MKKSRLKLQDGNIRLEGQPSARSVRLPEELTDSFVIAWFNLPEAHILSVASTYKRIPTIDWEKLHKWCVPGRDSKTDPLPGMWAAQARKWPSFSEKNGRWRLSRSRIIYEAYIGFPLVETVYITVNDIRLIETRPGSGQAPHQLLSAAEFRQAFGRTVVDYLYDYVDKQDKAVRLAISALESPPRKAVVTYGDSAGVTTEALVGPSGVPTSAWRMPDGSSFLSEG